MWTESFSAPDGDRAVGSALVVGLKGTETGRCGSQSPGSQGASGERGCQEGFSEALGSLCRPPL